MTAYKEISYIFQDNLSHLITHNTGLFLLIVCFRVCLDLASQSKRKGLKVINIFHSWRKQKNHLEELKGHIALFTFLTEFYSVALGLFLSYNISVLFPLI